MSTDQKLVHCIYCSRLSPDVDDAELMTILDKARAKNALLDVTGMLLADEDACFQVLEGPADVVRELYDIIRVDPRHEEVLKLIEEPIEERDFADWTMGIARLSRSELLAIPGLNDFFVAGRSLAELDKGRAKDLLSAFRNGRWRQTVEGGE